MSFAQIEEDDNDDCEDKNERPSANARYSRNSDCSCHLKLPRCMSLEIVLPDVAMSSESTMSSESHDFGGITCGKGDSSTSLT